MPEDRLAVAALTPVPHLRSRRLLRRLAEQAREEAFSRDRPSHHRRLRSPRRMGMVLRGRGGVRPHRPGDAAARADPAILLNIGTGYGINACAPAPDSRGSWSRRATS